MADNNRIEALGDVVEAFGRYVVATPRHATHKNLETFAAVIEALHELVTLEAHSPEMTLENRDALRGELQNAFMRL